MEEHNQIMDALKKERKRGRWQGALIAAIIILTLLLCFVVWKKIINAAIRGITTGIVADTYKSELLTKDVQEKVGFIEQVIDKYYLDEIDTDAMTDGIYKGLVSGLGDEYSTYYDQKEFSEMMEDTEGVFEGIGALLQTDPENGALTVVRPMKDSPAERAGVLAGDIIIEVDGDNVVGQDINLVVSKIRGRKGTKVKIGIIRENEEDTLYFNITRDVVESVTVESEMLDDDLGYLLITEFSDITADQFKKELNSLKKQGMKGLILDLRGNPGGNVDTAVDIADVLLPEGVVVYTIDKDGYREDYNSDSKCNDVPCIVLVNGYTASAAEILSGALKDYDRALLLGTTTYGKGIVQTVLSLGDGTGIKLTSAKYYTPNGVNIHKVGIEPDIVVEWDYEAYEEDGTDNQLNAAAEKLKEELAIDE
ncbi:MAG: S41 family peptidase [Lachnospiraceae bacterium]|nr:S41 family peptidase [Lachnospiraceae bacterium]